MHLLEDSVTKAILLPLGATATLSIPLQTQAGKIGALNCLRYHQLQPWKETEVELLSTVCNQLVIGLNQAELYASSRKSAQQAHAKSLELEETLRQIQQTQTQLIQSEKMSSLGQLVAGVAHEINNPVNFIYGNLIHADEYITNLLRIVKLYEQYYPHPVSEIQEQIEEVDLNFLVEDLPKLLDSMKLGAERIREIVKSLRTFSRLDEAEMKAVDLHENLDSTLMILQNRLKAKPDHPAIEVIREYGNLPWVECYAGQLNQVFMNLLGNAIDAVEERNKRLTLAEIQARPGTIQITTAMKSGDWIEIQIQDNGLGIRPEVVSRIFDPFYTTKPVGKGTGLGLSISYEIVVKKHKGQFSVNSQLGQGTEFIIQIPRRQHA